MKYKYSSGSGSHAMDRALGYFCRVKKETGSQLARAVTQERECLCGALRVLYAPYAPSGAELVPPVIRLEGLAAALGFTRTFSRMAEDGGRVETLFFRVFHARYGYPANHNPPLPKSVVAPVAPKAPPPQAAVQPPRASKPDDGAPLSPGRRAV